MWLFLLVSTTSLIGAAMLSFVMDRQGTYVVGVSLLVGAGIAMLGPIITSCHGCWTEALHIAVFASSPFFIVGWIALAQTSIFHLPNKLLYGLGGLMIIQLAWASWITVFATLEGNCPCGGALVGFFVTELPASGFDRLVGPWLLAEAVATLAILISIWRRLHAKPSHM